jgi:hypothetical protein
LRACTQLLTRAPKEAKCDGLLRSGLASDGVECNLRLLDM